MIQADARGGAATPVFHFTHIDNLPTIARDGLRCDSDVQPSGLLRQEIGNQGIKDLRRRRQVCPNPLVGWWRITFRSTSRREAP